MRYNTRIWLSWSAALVLLALSCLHAYDNVNFGLDFRAVYYGALNLSLHGDPYVVVPNEARFVYPPFGAAIFYPLIFLREDVVNITGLILGALSYVLLAMSCARVIERPWHSKSAATILAIISASYLGVGALSLTNISMVMAAGAAITLALIIAERWMFAAIVLGLTIAIKPLIFLGLLIFIIRKKWRAGLTATLLPVVLNLAVFPFLQSPIYFFRHIIPTLASGTTVPLDRNVALSAVIERAGGAPLLQTLASMLVVIYAAAIIISLRQIKNPLASTLLFITPILGFVFASRTDEQPYTLTAIPLIVVLITLAKGWARTLGITSTGLLIFIPLPIAATIAQMLLLLGVGVAARQCRSSVSKKNQRMKELHTLKTVSEDIEENLLQIKIDRPRIALDQ